LREKVLILGSNERAALTTIRALGCYNIHVSNIYFHRKEIANYSKYLKQSYFLGNPTLNTNIFIKNLISFLKKRDFGLLIPINDEANEIVYNYYEKIINFVKVADPILKCIKKPIINLIHGRYAKRLIYQCQSRI